ncbi:MAG: glycosyltransferase [Pedobacter sp.]|nr:MAG: glycosyltransferase [Pedobacter sp.]
MTYPLVSVCIPTYNNSNFIIETIHAIINQSYINLEIIIVNDGSTDETKEIIESINDQRIKLIHVVNGGAASARNIAFNSSNGDYIIFLDGDDYIEPDFIDKQINKISPLTNDIVLSSWGRFFNNNLQSFTEEITPSESITFAEWIGIYWINCNPMTNPGRAIIPRATILKSGLWDESLSLNDDLEFFTRIFIHSNKIVFNQEAKLYYRSGTNGLSSKKGKEASQSLYISIYKSVNHVLDYYKNDEGIKLACANMIQSYIYLAYPHHKEYTDQAEKEISKLATPSLKFESGGITKFLNAIIGWKMTKKIKMLIGW